MGKCSSKECRNCPKKAVHGMVTASPTTNDGWHKHTTHCITMHHGSWLDPGHPIYDVGNPTEHQICMLPDKTDDGIASERLV